MLEVGPLIFTLAVAGKTATLRPVEKAVEVNSRTQTVATRVTQRDFMIHLLRCTNFCAAVGAGSFGREISVCYLGEGSGSHTHELHGEADASSTPPSHLHLPGYQLGGD